MPQLDPTWFVSQLFWLAIIFVALHLVLSRLVLPPLMGTVERRKQTVTDDISQAESMRVQADDARTDYERTLAEARGKAQALINDTMQAHQSNAEQASATLEKQLEQKLAESARAIAAKADELFTKLVPETEALTSMIVEKLTNQAPAADKVKQAINQHNKG